MVLRSINLCMVLLFLGILSRVSQSLHFELQSGRTKCISEDIKSNSMTVGKYSVVNPNEAQPSPPSHKISIRVTSSYGNTYHHAEDVESGQFAFTAVEAGDYMACFTANDHKPEVTLSIDLDWRTGVHSKSWSSVAKKSQVEVMEFEVKKLIETVNSIHEEMFYLRERGGRDAKFEPGYKLENGVVEFPLSFRMLRSRRNAVFAFEDVFGEEESYLRWLDGTIPLYLFPNSRNLLSPGFCTFRSLA